MRYNTAISCRILSSLVFSIMLDSSGVSKNYEYCSLTNHDLRWMWVTVSFWQARNLRLRSTTLHSVAAEYIGMQSRLSNLDF